MAVQVGIGTFLGSDGGVTGYCDDSGRGLMRMKSSLDKAKWKRLPSMAGQREAARYFGAASKLAASVWRGVPRGMKRIMDAGAFNRLVGAFMGCLGEDGNVVDAEGIVGMELNEGSLSVGLRDESRWLSGGGMRVGLPAATDERLKRKDESLDADFDERLNPDGYREKDESRAAGVGGDFDEGLRKNGYVQDDVRRIGGFENGGGSAYGAHGGVGGGAVTVDSAGSAVNGNSGGGAVRFVMAQRFLGAGVVHCAPTDENLGSMEEFRAGVAAIRARQALCGEPERRRRTWVCVCEIGTVIVGGRGQFRLLQNGLGRGSFCTPWNVDDVDHQYSGLMRDEGGGMRVAGGVVDEGLRMKDEGNKAVLDESRWLSGGGMRVARGFDESRWLSGGGSDGNRESDESLGGGSLFLGSGRGLEEVLADPMRLVRAGFGESEGSGIFLVMVGTEWAEKRGRHWVRMPYACEVRVEQNLQDYLNSQNGVLDSGPSTSRPDSIPASGTGRMTSQHLQNGGLGSLDGDAGADLVGGGMVLEFKLSVAAADLQVWMGELATGVGGEVVCGAVVLGLGP